MESDGESAATTLSEKGLVILASLSVFLEASREELRVRKKHQLDESFRHSTPKITDLERVFHDYLPRRDWESIKSPSSHA